MRIIVLYSQMKEYWLLVIRCRLRLRLTMLLEVKTFGHQMKVIYLHWQMLLLPIQDIL